MLVLTADIVAQQVKMLPVMAATHMSTGLIPRGPLPIHLLANPPGTQERMAQIFGTLHPRGRPG